MAERMGYATRRWVAVACLLFASLSLAASAEAGELGHYFPGALNVRDYILPDKGVYAALYSIFYGSFDLRGPTGREISSVDVGGRTLTLDTELSLYSLVPSAIWNTGWTLLGAEYGVYGTLPFGGPSVSVALATPTGFGVESDTSTFGLGDLFLQPLWLRWRWRDVDLSGGVGVYAPSGRFDPGASDNVGLGFWTVQVQAAGAYYLLQKATALVLAGTYELHSEKEDTDVTPGQRFTLNYGVSQFLPAGPGLVELGLLGYSQWQLTHDSGADVSRFNENLDQVHAIGAQLGYAVPAWRLSVTAKYLYEYYAEARFRGQVATLSLVYQF